MGKFGIVSDMDPEGNGYFISIDLTHGKTTIRSWGINEKDIKQMFVFKDIQTALFDTDKKTSVHFRLIRYGHYIELGINGIVKLTLMDYTYSGNGFGLYTASSAVSLTNSSFHQLPDPKDEYDIGEEA